MRSGTISVSVSELVEPRVEVRPLTGEDAAWAKRLLAGSWGSTRVVSRGRVHDAAALPGFVAVLDGQRVALATYRIEDGACELVTLESVAERRGAGSRLLEAVRSEASRRGCRRLWLITTNDNTPALRLYQRRGFRLAALHRDAVAEARRLKPEIPRLGVDGIEIRDELELELAL